MTTQPVDTSKVQNAPHLMLPPAYTAPDGSVYVHHDMELVVDPWAVESHIPPVHGVETFGDVQSWASFIARYGASDALLTWNTRALRAVLDYHVSATQPNRCQWVAECPFIVSPEWTAWTRTANGQGIRQKDAIEFLEDHAEDIVEPAPTSLMGLLRSLRANVTAGASTELRPDGTTSVAFAQDKTLRAGDRGTVDIPSEIKIAVPVLKGHTDAQNNSVRYAMTIRLRASVDDQAHLALRLSLQNAERTLEAVCTERVEAARALLGSAFVILRAA